MAPRIARSVLIYIKAQPGLREHTCRTAPMARHRAACIGGTMTEPTGQGSTAFADAMMLLGALVVAWRVYWCYCCRTMREWPSTAFCS
jgi:hypothetical protein